MFLDLFRYFVQQEYFDSNGTNAFIEGFGNSYENFNPNQLVHFADSLAYSGLLQEDIYTAVLGSLDEMEI